ncbi:MAG: hypothetical protein H6Q84_2032 [Deltaproteobacteria bacterium]|nr:hypothetical protein [Deltaproteobacteria bacterium]
MIFEKEIAPASARETAGNSTLIYVPGGNQESLVPRFRKASDLYHRGVARKIHILSRPGITEYCPQLGRNLSNDEWSAREMEAFRVNGGDVVPVPVPPSYFGTLGEARRISAIVRQNGYKRLVVVSSSYHTRRLHHSFTRFLAGTPVEIYIYGADAGAGAGAMDLVAENFKLLLYDHAVLRFCAR